MYDNTKNGANKMAIGERIRFLRNLHGATQKWLGLKLGFSEKTAETRVGQYEIGARTPKDEMIKDIAEIFGVSPQAIKLPDLDNYNAVLHTLFAINLLIFQIIILPVLLAFYA